MNALKNKSNEELLHIKETHEKYARMMDDELKRRAEVSEREAFGGWFAVPIETIPSLSLLHDSQQPLIKRHIAALLRSGVASRLKDGTKLNEFTACVNTEDGGIARAVRGKAIIYIY
jgi:hypothetical protein